MAGEIRKKNSALIDALVHQPYRFSFFQAVRLLVASGGASKLGAPSGAVGTTNNASDESIRFRSVPALEFPASEIVSIQGGGKRVSEARDLPASGTTSQTEARPVGGPRQPIEMEIAFWGLIGPVGALPSHYTQLVIDRVREKDTALRDFLDLFSHRQASLFYRAWEKCFVPAGFERGLRQDNPQADLLREALLSIVGRGTTRVRGRLEILDDVSVYYGGAFIDRPNAESLRQIVSDFLGIDAEVLSLFGHWLRLPQSEQSRLGMAVGHSRLGTDTVLGEKTWDPRSKFRLRVGPVGLRDFQRLMPTGDQLIPICQLVRGYVGCEFSFDIQVVLLAHEIPRCRLGNTDKPQESANLGWNTWLCSQTPENHSDDAVFHHNGSPAVV